MPVSAQDHNADDDATDRMNRDLVEIHSISTAQDEHSLNRHIADLPSNESKEKRWLKKRIQELEDQLSDYEALMEELPELFERKFQQRLEPLLERYRLLAEASPQRSPRNPILLMGRNAKALPAFLRRRRTSDRSRAKQKTDRQAA